MLHSTTPTHCNHVGTTSYNKECNTSGIIQFRLIIAWIGPPLPYFNAIEINVKLAKEVKA